jgi:hypothetical protein
MRDPLPPELDVIHPDTGLAFALSDEAFNRWWATSILPEDAAEFVHLHHGTIEEARFVAALDYLTNVQQGPWNSDTIIRAYCLAQNRALDMRDSLVRANAQYILESPATSYLLDRVRYRSRRIAEERIANRTTTKIEEIFERTTILDGAERLNTERLALEMGIKYLSNQSRERGQEAERRAKKAVQSAMEYSRNSETDEKRVPTLAEAEHFLAMLAEHHGSEAIVGLLQKRLPGGNRTSD